MNIIIIITYDNKFKMMNAKLTLSSNPYILILTHSHTMTPFDAPGKQAF